MLNVFVMIATIYYLVWLLYFVLYYICSFVKVV